MTALPHIDNSGRGLDDGECAHCGASGSLDGWECPVRLREALDKERREHLSALIDPRALDRAEPMPPENPRCTRCNGHTAWRCASGTWGLGTLSCESCGKTLRRLIRKPDGSVHMLPKGTETHTMRLGRELRASQAARFEAEREALAYRRRVEAGMTVLSDPRVTKSPSPHPLYADGLTAGAEVLASVAIEALRTGEVPDA